jgi:hypothetical protein
LEQLITKRRVNFMRNHLIITVLCLSFGISLPVIAQADGLSCLEVDGAAIFGNDYGSYKFIGAIANEYSSESIGNEYGAGNEYRSDSIKNEYGSFGNPFGSYSAYNDFTSTPPILVNDNFEFIGYLTTNSALYPSIHPDIAVWCASKSFASSDSDLEDLTFKRIPPPATGYSSTYSCPAHSHANPANPSKCLCDVGYKINATQDSCIIEVRSCPLNSTGVWGSCTCNDGYFWINDACMSYTQNCKIQYGNNSYGDQKSCYCSTGYQWNSAKSACVKTAAQKSSASSKKAITTSKKVTSKAALKKGSSVKCNYDRRGKCGCPSGYLPQYDKCIKQ